MGKFGQGFQIITLYDLSHIYTFHAPCNLYWNTQPIVTYVPVAGSFRPLIRAFCTMFDPKDSKTLFIFFMAPLSKNIIAKRALTQNM